MVGIYWGRLVKSWDRSRAKQRWKSFWITWTTERDYVHAVDTITAANIESRYSGTTPRSAIPHTPDGTYAIAEIYNQEDSPQFIVWKRLLSLAEMGKLINKNDIGNMTTGNLDRVRTFFEISPSEKSPLARLIVTDSIPLGPEKLKSGRIVVLPIGGLLARAIKNIQEESSVTSLFV